MVAQGIPCLGPVTHDGCGALCPSYDRGCYGCFGPAEQPNLASLSRQFQSIGVTREALVKSLRGSFNGYAPEFRAEGDRLAGGPNPVGDKP
jgi:coenzyme F420-reducing hydrogenase gamma subunit